MECESLVEFNVVIKVDDYAKERESEREKNKIK